MLYFVSSPLVFRFPIFPSSSTIMMGSFRADQLQLLSPPPSCSVAFFFFFFFLGLLAKSEFWFLFSFTLYYSVIKAFHISVSRSFFTGVWVTASLLKSPALFLVFWPFSIMLSFGWSPLVRQLPTPPVPLVTL